MNVVESKVYEFIIEFIKENGYPPTYREIGKSLHYVVSMSVPHICSLESKGLIKTKPGCSRVIRVIGYEFVKQE